MKPKRIQNPELLAKIREMPCVVCHRTPSDPDHIKTKKSGGNDEEANLWPLCRPCHTKKHSWGLNVFVLKYPKLRKILESKGWTYDLVLKKWRRYE